MFILFDNNQLFSSTFIVIDLSSFSLIYSGLAHPAWKHELGSLLLLTQIPFLQYNSYCCEQNQISFLKTEILWENRKIRRRKRGRKLIWQNFTLILANFLKSECRPTPQGQSSHSICRSGQAGGKRWGRTAEKVFADIREIDFPRSDWSQKLNTRYAKIYLFTWFKNISTTGDLKFMDLIL